MTSATTKRHPRSETPIPQDLQPHATYEWPHSLTEGGARHELWRPRLPSPRALDFRALRGPESWPGQLH
eukprot:7581207-Prorocentrum_lima.AAC.1